MAMAAEERRRPDRWRHVVRRQFPVNVLALIGYAFTVEAWITGSWGLCRTVGFLAFTPVFAVLVVIPLIGASRELWREHRSGGLRPPEGDGGSHSSQDEEPISE